MQFGIGLPIVVTPNGTPAWEFSAGIAEVAEIAKAGDRLGYDFVTCSEHVAVPTAVENARGLTFWDPLALFGYLAAITTRIRFATYILVLGYHHPLAIAKRYGTLDAVSGGRLILGLGVGNLQPEFELLDAAFDDRGPRADEALRALRTSLSQRQPQFKGEYHNFDDFVVLPHAVQDKVPLWVGGTSMRSLKRAVALADGWAPVFIPGDKLTSMLASVERPAGFEIVLQSSKLDPLNHPEETRQAIGEMTRLGATRISVKVASSSFREYLDQIEAFHDVMGMGNS